MAAPAGGGPVAAGDARQLLLQTLIPPAPEFVPAPELTHDRPQNDNVWENVDTGPIKIPYAVPESIDDICTVYAGQWMNCVQSATNMLQILDALVKKYHIVSGAPMHDIPQEIKGIYESGAHINCIDDQLMEIKTQMRNLAQIRRAWKSIDAFIAAPDELRIRWLTARSNNNFAQQVAQFVGTLNYSVTDDDDLPAFIPQPPDTLRR